MTYNKMQNSVLYPNLIDATANIIKKFGKDVIHEDRFVNVLSDLSPGRNEPAVFKIIKSAILNDLLKDVLNSNAKNIEHHVTTATAVLSKQYGYDQSLVEGILFSLAVGYGTITIAQYNALKALKSKPSKKLTPPPSQNNNQNKQRPTKNNSNPYKKRKIDWIKIKYIISLIWGILGLTISPLIYLLGVGNSDGICILGSFYVALIHLFTIVPVSVVIEGPSSTSNTKTYPSIAGAMYGLMVCAIIFWCIFPILFGFKFILNIWEIDDIKEPFPWITTIFANWVRRLERTCETPYFRRFGS